MNSKPCLTFWAAGVYGSTLLFLVRMVFSLCVHVYECTCIYLCIHRSQRSLLEVFLTCFLPLKKAFSCMYVHMYVCTHVCMWEWTNVCVPRKDRRIGSSVNLGHKRIIWCGCWEQNLEFTLDWLAGISREGLSSLLSPVLEFLVCTVLHLTLLCGVRIKHRLLHFCDTLQTKPSHQSLNVI